MIKVKLKHFKSNGGIDFEEILTLKEFQDRFNHSIFGATTMLIEFIIE